MDCLRCHGLMVAETFDEVRGDPRDVRFHGWRCVSCGNIVDPVIIRHRAYKVAPVLTTIAAPVYTFPDIRFEAPAA